MDLFYFFFHKSLDIVKNKGVQLVLLQLIIILLLMGQLNLRNDIKDTCNNY